MRVGETEESIRGKGRHRAGRKLLLGTCKADLCMFALLPANNTNQTRGRQTQTPAQELVIIGL